MNETKILTRIHCSFLGVLKKLFLIGLVAIAISSFYPAIDKAIASEPLISITATKIICDTEAALPNWNSGNTDIVADTAANYVQASQGLCHLESGWDFQWAPGNIANPGDHVGEAQCGWTTFGSTGNNGATTTSLLQSDLGGTDRIWVREVFRPGYIGFTNTTDQSNVSAEMWCHQDVVTWDNYDYIYNPQVNSSYYCVAFNVSNIQPQCNDGIDNDGDGTIDMLDGGCDSSSDDDENQPPVITILGNNPMNLTVGSTFTDPGATATDTEDGNLTASIIIFSTVNASVVGTYSVTYNVTDSDGAHAVQMTRVVVISPVPGCVGCGTLDNPPTITVLGSNPMTSIVGNTFTDPGATAFDAEDGNITSYIVALSTVNTSVVGSYTVTYNVMDSYGNSAIAKNRVVNIIGGFGSIDQPPVITILGNNPMNLTVGSTFTDPGATATDTEDGNLTASIISFSTVNASVVGTYSVTYNVTDSYGNSAIERVRVVNVVTGSGCVGDCGGDNPEPPASCNYLLEYLKLGANNNPVEVKKLQLFLKNYEGFANLSITEIFDQATFDAVTSFQIKYQEDVLNPWGLDESTGYVYITTKNKVNEIYCAKEFPLSVANLAEIEAYKSALEASQQEGTEPTTPSNEVGQIESNSNVFVQGTNGDNGGGFTTTGDQTKSLVQGVIENDGSMSIATDVESSTPFQRSALSAALMVLEADKQSILLIGLLCLALLIIIVLISWLTRKQLKLPKFN